MPPLAPSPNVPNLFAQITGAHSSPLVSRAQLQSKLRGADIHGVADNPRSAVDIGIRREIVISTVGAGTPRLKVHVSTRRIDEKRIRDQAALIVRRLPLGPAHNPREARVIKQYEPEIPLSSKIDIVIN
jgi:hypothetical protein